MEHNPVGLYEIAAIIRIGCYVVISLRFIVMAARLRRQRALGESATYGSLALFFAWLVYEAAMSSSGVNTYAMRILATPLTAVAAIFSIRFFLPSDEGGYEVDRIPGAVWPIVFGGIYAGLQVFVAAQWPDAPPATVLGLMAALGVLMGTLKILWPDPPAPQLPPGVSAQAGMVAPAKKRPSKISLFFI